MKLLLILAGVLLLVGAALVFAFSPQQETQIIDYYSTLQKQKSDYCRGAFEDAKTVFWREGSEKARQYVHEKYSECEG